MFLLLYKNKFQSGICQGAWNYFSCMTKKSQTYLWYVSLIWFTGLVLVLVHQTCKCIPLKNEIECICSISFVKGTQTGPEQWATFQPQARPKILSYDPSLKDLVNELGKLLPNLEAPDAYTGELKAVAEQHIYTTDAFHHWSFGSSISCRVKCELFCSSAITCIYNISEYTDCKGG